MLINPLDNECNLVRLRFKEGLKELFLDTGARTISDTNLAMLVRQLAVHVNVRYMISSVKCYWSCAVLCCAVLCCTVQCRVMLCCAVLCCAVLCCAVLCNISII